MKVIAFLSFVTIVTLFAGCSDSELESITASQTLNHTNGLAVALPTGFDAIETESGYVLVQRANVRFPRQMQLYIESVEDAGLTLTRDIEGAAGSAKYTIMELGSGSAGIEYELTATKAVAGRFITVKAIEQSERGQPSFNAVWALFESAIANAPE